jgi:GNAT superfamily N-acetyltransferase
MPIRFATTADIAQLVQLGQQIHGQTRFKHQDYNAAKVAESLHGLVTRGQGKYGVFVAENGERQVVGVLIGVMEQPIFSERYTASVVYFLVRPEARMGGWGVRLLRAFEQWAANRKACEITFGINSGGDADGVARFAERMGYRRIGSNHAKECR